MRGSAYRLAYCVALLLLAAATSARAHIDAPHVSLSQLFLSADVVAIARIDRVAERPFLLGDQPTLKEVVSARISQQYKGTALQSFDVFRDAHGHAHYAPGDTAVLFLNTLDSDSRLGEVGAAADVGFVSRQARNTEHRMQPAEVPDYDWILSSYAGSGSQPQLTDAQRGQQVKAIILRMLASSSTDLVESGLLDWAHAGGGVQFTEGEAAALLALTRDPTRPVNLRLAILRAMQRNHLADSSAWIHLFRHEPDENLPPVIRSTEGYEDKQFLPYLLKLLDHPTEIVVESAARALGNPIYEGAEAPLGSLLDTPSQRLNYAAVDALLGLNNDAARDILLNAQTRHPNPKVRRLISARLSALS